MERRKALATAGAVTTVVVAATLALGANLGLFGLTDDGGGPGTFDPVDASVVNGSTPRTEVIDVPMTVPVPGDGGSAAAGAPGPAPAPELPAPAPSPRVEAAGVDSHLEEPGHDDDDHDDDHDDDAHEDADHDDD